MTDRLYSNPDRRNLDEPVEWITERVYILTSSFLSLYVVRRFFLEKGEERF
jgi:hypothetical protein